MPDLPSTGASATPDLNPAHQGLGSAQAASRLAQEGPNALPRPPKRTVWRIGAEVASEPMFQLLGAAAGIYLVLGDLSEASVLMFFLLVIAGITVTQERRAERVLEALQDLTSPRALVWRDGERQRIAGMDVVREDIIELGEGDRIPADARLLSANDLLVDESLLSGESLPVVKHADGQTSVFAGTMVVAGQGVAQVTATGVHSEIGRIGKVLGAIAPEITPLARQTRQLVRWFSVLGLLVSLTVGGLYVWNYHDWLGGALAGITMAMSMLPEEFLLILTVFMAMGAWRLSQHRVLTRRAATIEALGAATVLCTDKTGTLTLNRMAVDTLVRWHEGEAQAWTSGDGPLPASFLALLQHGVLASESTPIDPMERAIHALGAAHPAATPAAGWTLVHEYGLSPDLPAMSHVWSPGDGRPFVVACKGAPESVAALCRLPSGQSQDMLARAGALADKGMRVLGVAVASWPQADWPATQQGFDFRLLGLVALADPLRDNVPQAVRECQQAGIRVVMITGDHLGTALAIARQAGIDTSTGGIRGDEITAMSDEVLRQKAAHATVFARIAPQQKLRIVQALKADGEVVAMTGDGVNDAPSLKAAHIGIAMGGRGTDVAREAASLVLLDDDFNTLVKAIRLGRRIYDNLHKASRFVFAVHVPIAGLTLVPLALGWPLLFTPMHIAFLEIVIDPVCSIVFEAEDEEADVMARPPRDPAARLFTPGMVASSIFQGLLVLGGVGLYYGAMLQAGIAQGQARAAAFVALVMCNVALILVNRSVASDWRASLGMRNRTLGWTILATLALLAAVLLVPALRRLFGFEWPSAPTLAGALGIALAALSLLLLQQAVQRRLRRTSGTGA